jgi:hypothetical protein
MSRPYVQEEVARVYRAVGVRNERRYLTERAAFRAVAWQMVRDKYPEDFEYSYTGESAGHGYFEPARPDYGPLVERLTRWLMRRARRVP